MKGIFITFEGSEGCGKSTQVTLLADRLAGLGHSVVRLREPGGTPIGEEIRHTLKHSARNEAMTPEAELLLMNACRAQLVREVIRPALCAGQVVVCDRFYDSTVAYQGYGRGLDLRAVQESIRFAVGDSRPDLTLLLTAPAPVLARRLAARQMSMPFVRDRIESADREFFRRVDLGYEAVAKAEPLRVRKVDASGTEEEVAGVVWREVEPLFAAARH